MRPAFEHYTLGEITTGRVEWFLRREAAPSYGRAKHTRTLLHQLFAFAQRHDAIVRDPVEGTSPLTRPRHEVHAMTLEQVQAIRAAAAWRTGPEVKGPRPDGKVRDLCEVLLGTSMRPGEALGLRPCDVVETRTGMVVHVQGTVVRRAFLDDAGPADSGITPRWCGRSPHTVQCHLSVTTGPPGSADYVPRQKVAAAACSTAV